MRLSPGCASDASGPARCRKNACWLWHPLVGWPGPSVAKGCQGGWRRAGVQKGLKGWLGVEMGCGLGDPSCDKIKLALDQNAPSFMSKSMMRDHP